MGAFNSIHTEMREEEEGLPCTPSQEWKQKRRLNMDPRSPSENISRTPIIVNTTPSQLMNDRAEEANEVMDPRSPTTDFTRTPLCLGNTSSSPGRKTPARTPSISHSVNSQSVHSGSYESGIDSADVSPVNNDTGCHGWGAVSSPDSALSYETTDDMRGPSPDHLLSGSFCDLNPDCMVDNQEEIPADLKHLHISENHDIPNTREADPFHRGVRLRPHFIEKNALGLHSSMKSQTPRSPLSFVDNSPMIETKGQKKVPVLIEKHCPTGKLSAMDKENICH